MKNKRCRRYRNHSMTGQGIKQNIHRVWPCMWKRWRRCVRISDNNNTYILQTNKVWTYQKVNNTGARVGKTFVCIWLTWVWSLTFHMIPWTLIGRSKSCVTPPPQKKKNLSKLNYAQNFKTTKNLQEYFLLLLFLYSHSNIFFCMLFLKLADYGRRLLKILKAKKFRYKKLCKGQFIQVSE